MKFIFLCIPQGNWTRAGKILHVLGNSTNEIRLGENSVRSCFYYK